MKKKMKVKDMSVVGNGVYLVSDWNQMRPWPKETMKVIPGFFNNPIMEEALFFFASYSVKKGAWCGIDWNQLSQDIHTGFPTKDHEKIKLAIEAMIRGGFLHIPKEFTMWGTMWLNRFCIKVVCPTQKLMDQFQKLVVGQTAEEV